MSDEVLQKVPREDDTSSKLAVFSSGADPQSDIKEQSLREADELKQEGNEYFRASQWEQALAAYKMALSRLPKRPEIHAEPQPSDDDDDGRAASASHGTIPENGDDSKESEIARAESDESGEVAKTRAVINANIGACHIKLGDHKEVVKACTQALADDPQYIKALQRRAASNEKINSWSSLTSAQEDYTTLLKVLPSSSPLRDEIQRSLRHIGPRVEAAQKRETAEMLDKLKGMGNSILGNFGLSTDNFKLEPNGQGGYSMNFVK